MAIAPSGNLPTVLDMPASSAFTTTKHHAVRIARIRPSSTFVRNAVPVGLYGNGSATAGVTRAPQTTLDMVESMPTFDRTADPAFATRVGRLGRMLDDVDFGDSSAGVSPLHFLSRTAPRPQTTFLEAGPVTRKVDADGRIKLVLDAGSLCELLTWGAGSLEVTAVDGWLILRQPADLVGVKTARYDCRAGVTRDTKGLERICLKPAHLAHLELGPDRQVLVVALINSGHVALVNPSVCLFGSPPAVTQILADASSAA